MKLKIEAGENREIKAQPGPTLLEFLRGADVAVNAACGGKGKCQKCRVQITDGFAGITSVDRAAFHETELAAGWRLSCQCIPKTNATIKVPGLAAANQKATWHTRPDSADIQDWGQNPDNYVLTLDLGSTGLALAAARKSDSKIVAEVHALNPQISFGADVMTRLEAAMRIGVGPLQQAILQGIQRMIALFEAQMKLPEPLELWSAGNSAMTSFIHGWDILSLAVSPFQPKVMGKSISSSFVLEGRTVTLRTLPLIAGFVGGDTTAGILAIEAQIKEKNTRWMLIDVGTNTEIVIRDPEKNIYFTTSAPAGPAFEGGNISCGMRAEAGAIAKASFQNHKWSFTTIQNDKPNGICGSGLIEILDQGLQGGLILKDGLVPEGKIQLTHDLSLSRDDVREFQLAKSATRTAADLLCNRAGFEPEILFLAGNFAGHINLQAALRMGLLPKAKQTVVLGNGSLLGLIAFQQMTEAGREQFTERLEAQKHPIELALQDDFQENFVRNLNF